MKLINIFAAFIIFAIVENTFAQEPDPLSFFPHSVGNVWEYDTPEGVQRMRIINDSLDEDGNKYLFYGSIFDPRYCVEPKTSRIIYLPKSLNWVYYELDADSGETWMVRPEDSSVVRQEALVENKYSWVIFGQPTVIMQIGYYDLNPGDTVINEFSWKLHTEWLASGFGLIEVYNNEPPLGPQKLLLGCVIDGDTFGIVTSVKEDLQNPSDYQLLQNYPNPFNPETTIRFQIQNYSFVELKVFDLLGQEISVLINEEKPAGNYQIKFNGSNLSSGTYIYRLKTNNRIISRKMILMK